MSDDANLLISMLPWLLMSIPMAVGNFLLAPRLNKSRAIWLVLSLIPILNLFFLVYVYYVVVSKVLDRLEAIAARVGVDERQRA